MNPLATKALVGVGGLTLVGGGGILAWQQGVFSSSSKSIRERLLSKGYKILDSNSDEWTKIFDVYKGVENTKWKFENDGIDTQSKEVQKLKNRCDDILKNDSSDEKNYFNAAKWCVVPRKLESFIDSTSFLNDEENNDTHQKEWKRVLGKYTTTKIGENSTAKYAMEGVILESSTGTEKDADNIKKIKEGCRNRKAKYNYFLDFEDSLSDVNKWCTVEASK